MGFNKADVRKTVYDALLQGSGFKEIIQKTALPYLDVVTSDVDLDRCEVELIQQETGRGG